MYKIGDKASFRRTVTESDLNLFAGLSGDFNPIHIDAIGAAESVFGRRIAHGHLISSYISAVIGMKLPGPGAVCMEQHLKFLRPVYIGDTVTASVEVDKILRADKNIIRLITWVRNQESDMVVEGYTIVKAQ